MSARADIVPVFVPHLGCPHSCVFCDQHRITGQETPAVPETVIQAMRQTAALPYGAKRQLEFYGGSFTAIPPADQETLLSAAKEFISRGELTSIRVSTRPDAISSDVLKRLESFGVKTVEIGAQSMDDEVLRMSGRGHSASDVERAARQIRKAGFSLVLQMMTGLPGATDEKDIFTAEKLIALNPDAVRIYPTVIVRGTALHRLWMEGAVLEHTVEDAVRVCSRIVPMFEDAGIDILRIGLNPTDQLSGGDAVAGAYHPALGELVRSRIFRNRAEQILMQEGPLTEAELGVNAADLSQMIGQRRENILYLRGRLGLEKLSVRPVQVQRGKILLLKKA